MHSVAGVFDPGDGLVRRPPFEDPHHTATPAAIVGGGTGTPRPGAASRAHRGVLFLDEAPEFGARVLQTLRQPLEHGELVIHRAAGSARYPARFQLVLAANPCPCGKGVGKGLDCTCSPVAQRRYFGRLSGPLLDRVDVQVEVRPVLRAALVAEAPPESTATVAARVLAAREAAFTYHYARRILCVSESAKENLARSWNLDPQKIVVMANGVDTVLFSPDYDARPAREKWGLGDRPVVREGDAAARRAQGLDRRKLPGSSAQETRSASALLENEEGLVCWI